MSKCPGLHCDGCGDGDGWAVVLALIIALAVIGAILRAIWHTLVEAAEIAALTVLSLAGLAAVTGLGYAVLRVRARVASSRARRVIPIRAEVIRLGSPVRGAIEAPTPRPTSSRWPLPGQWEEINPDTDRRTS